MKKLLFVLFVAVILVLALTVQTESIKIGKKSTKAISLESLEKTAKPILLKSRQIRPEKIKPQPMNLLNIFSNKKVHVFIQFDHPLSKKERKKLENDGIKILNYIPENTWTASIKESRIQDIRARDDVTFIDRILPMDKLAEGVLDEERLGKLRLKKSSDIPKFNVIFFPDVFEERKQEILNNFDKHKSIEQLVQNDEVKWVEPVPKLKSYNDDVRDVIGVDVVQAAPYNLSGTGVIVAEWDGGWIDTDHYDFAGRITIGDENSCNNPNDGWSDSGTCGDDYHTTHVGGTMAGNGNRSAANGGTALQWKGMAPNATIRTYEWPDNNAELLNESADAALNNVILSQNSWGYDASFACSVLGRYDSQSQIFDNITNGFEISSPISVVFAAGNDRDDSYCNIPTNPYNTTSGPGSAAKNTITVGAVTDSFVMTSFSSWGPTDDGRIKPDVVAPGSGIYSTRPGNIYATKSGTSMAAPVVSGIVALIYQDYKSTHNNSNPLPSTAKAILIHTAVDQNNTGPDYTTGWGLVNATTAIDKIREDVNGTEVIVEENITNTTDSKTYYVYVPSGQSYLKTTLVWDDYPGDVSAAKELVNDLDLVITNSTGSRFYPWTLDQGNPGDPAVRNTTDNTNPVEQVYISNPNEGFFTIKINGTIPQGPETFSLVSDYDINPEKPIVTLVSPENNYNTNSTSILFNCSAQIVNGAELENVTLYTNVSGNWTANQTYNISGTSNSSTWNLTNISDGNFIWNCLVYNNISNSSWYELNYTFTVDATKPTISLISPNNQLNTSNQTINFTFNVTDNIDTSLNCSLYINSNLNSTNSSVGNYTETTFSVNISEAEYNWSIGCTDDANNSNQSETRFLTVDRTPPNISIITPTNRSYNNQTILVNISANDSYLDSIWFWNGTENISYSTPAYYNFSEGSHTIIAYANDSAGNLNQTNITFSLDLTAPVITILSPINTVYNKRSLDLNFSINETNLESCWYNYNGTNTTTSSCSNTTITGLDDQESSLILYANDTAGNTNSSTINFSVYTPDLNYIVTIENYSSTSGNVSLNITNINQTNLELTVPLSSFSSNITSNFIVKNSTGEETSPSGNQTYKSINTTGIDNIIVTYSILINQTNQTNLSTFSVEHNYIDQNYGILNGENNFWYNSNSSINTSMFVRFNFSSNWTVVTPWNISGDYYSIASTKALQSLIIFGNLTVGSQVINGTNVSWAYPANASRPYQENEFYYENIAGETPTFSNINYTPNFYSAYVDVFNESLTDRIIVILPLFVGIDSGGDVKGYSVIATPYAIPHTASHEMFHLWNGKIIKQNSSEERWFVEGVTEYYSCYARWQSGYHTQRQFYETCLNDWYNTYNNTTSSNSSYNMSVVEAGPLSSGSPSVDNYSAVIYGKGAILAFFLGEDIKANTSSQKDLNDLMRHMYQNYNFENSGVKYTNNNITEALNNITLGNFTDFFDNYINGTVFTQADGNFSDSDSDGLLSVYETILGTNLIVADTDGDGVSDGSEVDAGTDPLVSNLVSVVSGGGGGGASSTPSTKTYNIGSLTKTGTTKSLSEKDEIKFTVSGKSHSVTAVEIKTTTAKFKVASSPVNITMKIGEIDKLDIDDVSTTHDLKIKLNNISGGKADVTLKLINETFIKPKPKICEPKTKKCTGKDLQICSSDGTGWEKETTCEYKCENKKCIPKPVENITKPIELIPAQETPIYLSLIILVIVVVVGIYLFKIRKGK